jgi:hypothetical protein
MMLRLTCRNWFSDSGAESGFGISGFKCLKSLFKCGQTANNTRTAYIILLVFWEHYRSLGVNTSVSPDFITGFGQCLEVLNYRQSTKAIFYFIISLKSTANGLNELNAAAIMFLSQHGSHRKAQLWYQIEHQSVKWKCNQHTVRWYSDLKKQFTAT